MKTLEKRVALLEKQVAELREATQPNVIGKIAYEEASNLFLEVLKSLGAPSSNDEYSRPREPQLIKEQPGESSQTGKPIKGINISIDSFGKQAIRDTPRE